MVTFNAAKGLGIDDELGNFEVGKTFDALLIDLDAPSSHVDTYEENSFEVIWYLCSVANF